MEADWQEFNAFILTAGLGKRLRPHTDTVPKPMVPVNGRPILDYTLDHLKEAGVTNVTLNLYYKGEVIRDHLADRNDLSITLSEEKEILDTGLGMKRALETIGGKPFYAINGDALWTDGPSGNTLWRLAENFDPDKMDILLLLHPLDKMHLTQGTGDYHIDDQGRAIRAMDKDGEYAFAGVRITKPDVFGNTPDEPFSFLRCMDDAQARGRLYALIHDGEWHHISTPEDLARVNEAFAVEPPVKMAR